MVFAAGTPGARFDCESTARRSHSAALKHAAVVFRQLSTGDAMLTRATNDNRHIAFTRQFSQRGPFEAYNAACAFAQQAGFCVVQTSVDNPVGLMHGYDWVAKWRNLTPRERTLLHGSIIGERRHGPVVMLVFSTAPFEARVALSSFEGCA